MLIGRSASGVSGSAAASDSYPKSARLALSVRSLMLPKAVLLLWIIVPSGEMVTLVL